MMSVILLVVTIIVLRGVGAGGQLGSGRGWEDEDVCTGSILRRVQLGGLQVQSSTAAEH